MFESDLKGKVSFSKYTLILLVVALLLVGLIIILMFRKSQDKINAPLLPDFLSSTEAQKPKPSVESSYAHNRVDPSGKYVSTLRNSGAPNHNDDLVIKDVVTGESVYVLTEIELAATHPNLVGYLGLGTWVERPDGTYLYQVLQDGRIWGGLLYVKRDTWETHIYETPKEVMAVAEREFAPFEPLLAFTNVTGYLLATAGDVEEELYQDQLRDASQKILSVADLRSGNKVVLATVSIVKGHRFNPTWLSDTELEYTMPNGTRKMYRVEE